MRSSTPQELQALGAKIRKAVKQMQPALAAMAASFSAIGRQMVAIAAAHEEATVRRRLMEKIMTPTDTDRFTEISHGVAEAESRDTNAPLDRVAVLRDMDWLVGELRWNHRQVATLEEKERKHTLARAAQDERIRGKDERLGALQAQINGSQEVNRLRADEFDIAVKKICDLETELAEMTKQREAAADILRELHADMDHAGIERASTVRDRFRLSLQRDGSNISCATNRRWPASSDYSRAMSQMLMHRSTS